MNSMNFNAALAVMLAGGAVRCPEWKGFWSWDQDSKNIRMHLKDGSSMLLTETEQPLYTFQCIARDDFIDCSHEKQEAPVNTFSFSDALRFLKAGKCVARKGWNGKGAYLLIYKGQQDIAKAFGYGFGECLGEFSFSDVIAMKTADDKMVLGWLASQTDMLANDWVLYEAK